jgi:signal transduction histidine kinase
MPADRTASEKPFILYVDDEQPNRVVFERTFQKTFPIEVVGSAGEALQVLASREVAVLVTDQRMPEMTGNELLRVAKEKHPDVIRMIITAYSDLDPILAAVNDGLVARYVVKPWEREELESMLRWALETYEVGRESNAIQLRLLETERLSTLGSINAALIHEMAQPLSYMLGASERLEMLLLPLSDKELSFETCDWSNADKDSMVELLGELPELSDALLGGSKVLTGLIHNATGFIHANPNRERSVCTPMTAIRFAMAICSEVAARARAGVAYDGPKQLPALAIGQTELTQVLINLIRNAAHAIARKQTAGQVGVSATLTPPRLSIAVTDNGCGMTEEVRNQVGKLFFSGTGTGAGLGLFQCRRIIEGRGGALEIESQPDVGTTITIRIPIAADKEV